MINYKNENIYDAEQSVLGSLLLSEKLHSNALQKIFSLLKPTSFKAKHHQVLFSAIKELYNEQRPIDLITTDQKLLALGKSEDTGGMAYLADLTKQLPTTANVMAYVEIVRLAAQKRFSIDLLNNCISKIANSSLEELSAELNSTEAKINSLTEKVTKDFSTGPVHVSDIADKWWSNVNNRIENPEKYGGYTSGISGLDKILAPVLLPKDALIVVGARPKMGKSAFLTNIIEHFALSLNQPSLVFSLEMSDEKIFERLVSSQANIESAVFYDKNYDDLQMARASKAVGIYKKSNLYIDDTAGINLNYIKRKARNLNRDKKLAIIGVDYLTLMNPEKADRNDLAYGAITRELKNLAKELNCIVLLLTQLNRGLESRANKRPMPSDGRDTGQIEQDCDLWIGLYRESVYTDIPAHQQGITEAIIRLNRNGKTGTAYLDLKDGYFTEGKALPTTYYQDNY